MNKIKTDFSIWMTGSEGERGATAVIVAIVMTLLLMLTALAVDVGHLYGVRNELHNAADAGALGGAGYLFDSNGNLARAAAINEAIRVVELNKTGTEFVDEYEVETGHWSFSTRTFTANAATEQLAGWESMSTEDLDANTGFINAVRVKAVRSDTPSFFARIFGLDQFLVGAEGVAWMGFSIPLLYDLPIALCEDKILDADGNPTCNQARMANSGNNPSSNMTAMWTNFTQQNPNADPPTTCETASGSDMQGLTDSCAPISVQLSGGLPIGVQNGVQDNVFGNIVDCWIADTDTDGDGIPDTLWRRTLPVVKCDDNTCATFIGGAEVDMAWMVYKNDPQMDDVPTSMTDDDGTTWNCSSATTDTYEERLGCWKEFVDNFELENATGPPASDEDYEDMYQMRNIFFKPRCEIITGGYSGGQNLGGGLAEYPKLVQ